ncbi:MAG: ParB N-terminal domain-containing protein, partial [Chloroflexi bacterium]|nr:ParB N-terminal domain-containing protein [Chloroflexota bacterium]
MTGATAMQIEYLPVDDLRPDPANPRRISDAELEALTRSVREFGFIDPVIARREDRTVIGGHQRLLAVRRLGMKTVPVVLVDLSIEQARLLNVALNKISGSWDHELLARLLADLQPIEGIDLTLSGFGEDEVAKLLKSLDARDRRERAETFDLDQALEEAGKSPARTQPGDLWLLGEHRLLCGDSTDPAAVARVLAGQTAAMAFTDPPYNVAYGDHGGHQRGARKRKIANDAMPAAEWEAFCRGWARNLV